MAFNRSVLLPDGQRRTLADNQIPYDLDCPIDGTQLAERTEYDYTAYDCITCNALYQVRRGRITQEELERQAESYLKNAVKRVLQLDAERNGLLRIIELAKQNNFS